MLNENHLGKRMIPLLLSAGLILADQLSKLWILSSIPLNTVGHQVGGGDFLRIIHVRNLGMAFSLGAGMPDWLRVVVFIVIPLSMLIALGFYLVLSREPSTFQRWILAGIIGGGLGNQIDRIFRPLGVVDFIDVKFYGLFGLERWPTFNIADSTVVICAILLGLNLLFGLGEGKKHEKELGGIRE
ncbi:signal peptidase II [Spirochaeta lutea]|nr:signal peptidase II [Spirochaeta lutea]